MKILIGIFALFAICWSAHGGGPCAVSYHAPSVYHAPTYHAPSYNYASLATTYVPVALTVPTFYVGGTLPVSVGAGSQGVDANLVQELRTLVQTLQASRQPSAQPQPMTYASNQPQKLSASGGAIAQHCGKCHGSRSEGGFSLSSLTPRDIGKSMEQVLSGAMPQGSKLEPQAIGDLMMEFSKLLK